MQTDEANQRLDRAYELVEAGSLVEARALFEQISQQDPGHAEAWMMLGSLDAELGNVDQALTELSRAIELDPTMPESWYYLASVQRSRGELQPALGNIEKALALDPDYGEAFLLAGALHAMQGQPDRSEQYCRRAVELLPGSPDAHFNLGNILLQQGNAAQAREQFAITTQLQPANANAWNLLGRTCAHLNDITGSREAYEAALKLQPDSAEACYGLGFTHFSQGQYEAAADYFTRALQSNPAYAEAANGLGTACQMMGTYEDAVNIFQRALDIRANYAEAMFGKARALIELGRQPEAVPLLRQALQIQPDYLEAHLNLAAIMMALDRPEEAMQSCNRALELKPDNPDAIALEARIKLQAGQGEEAWHLLQPHVAAGVQHVNLAIAWGDACRSMKRPQEAVELLESLQSGQNPLSVVNRRCLHFCLGSLYDKMGEYDRAFDNYRAGNQLRAREWDAATNRAQIDKLIGTFSQAFLDNAPRAGKRSEKPVFILGMPRSGSSLVEQILASHPAVFGAGELPGLLSIAARLPGLLYIDLPFPQYMPVLNQEVLDRVALSHLAHLDELAPDALRVIDKMPGNFSFLGLIELLFPGARVIHCTRDPFDTCLSCYFQDFAMSHPYAFDFDHLGAFYRDYQRLMEHWKKVLKVPMLDVRYEDLVADQETVSRRMVEFCGLDWDDACLQFHASERFVATSSYHQVRQPVYATSVRRWENYQEHIGPLMKALQDGAEDK